MKVVSASSLRTTRDRFSPSPPTRTPAMVENCVLHVVFIALEIEVAAVSLAPARVVVRACLVAQSRNAKTAGLPTFSHHLARVLLASFRVGWMRFVLAGFATLPGTMDFGPALFLATLFLLLAITGLATDLTGAGAGAADLGFANLDVYLCLTGIFFLTGFSTFLLVAPASKSSTQPAWAGLPSARKTSVPIINRCKVPILKDLAKYRIASVFLQTRLGRIAVNPANYIRVGFQLNSIQRQHNDQFMVYFACCNCIWLVSGQIPVTYWDNLALHRPVEPSR